MNAKTKKLTTLAGLVLTFYLFSMDQSALAQGEQSPSEQREQTIPTHSNCHKVRGKLNEVSNPTGTTGIITNGGILNGTTQLVFTSGILPTPDPAFFSYTTDFTITTRHGRLKTSNVGIFDSGTGAFSEIGRINPNTSTGRFAGATGLIFTNGKTPDGGATFQSDITAEICFDR